MRTVSASACARVQSSESTAAVAAEFFSSVLREVGMAFLRGLSVISRRFSLLGRVFCWVKYSCWVKYLEVRAKVNPALCPRRPFSLPRRAAATRALQFAIRLRTGAFAFRLMALFSILAAGAIHVFVRKLRRLARRHRLYLPVRAIRRSQSGGLFSQPAAASDRSRRRQPRCRQGARAAQERQPGAGDRDLGQCHHQCVADAIVGLALDRARPLLLLGIPHHIARRDHSAGVFLAQRAADDLAIPAVPGVLSRRPVSAREANGHAARLVARRRRHGLSEGAGYQAIDRATWRQRRRDRATGGHRRAEFSRARRRLGLR